MTRALLALMAGVCLASTGFAESIRGEYLEARNADVWTGPCFANAEIGIVGDKAVMAWKVTEGEYAGVSLDGLSIVAVVIGDDTFGIGRPVTTRSVLIVDEKATAQQQAALIAMAKASAPETLQTVAGVRVAPISMVTAYCDGKGCASVESTEVSLKTRCLGDHDVVCSNESLYYPPLAEVSGEYAAYTLKNEYRGKTLNSTFADNGARSAVIANFSL